MDSHFNYECSVLLKNLPWGAWLNTHTHTYIHTGMHTGCKENGLNLVHLIEKVTYCYMLVK